MADEEQQQERFFRPQGQDRPRRDGGVEVLPANADDLNSYREAQRQLGQMRAPVMVHADNKHERLFVAVLDGTGNNMHKDDDANETGIVRLYKQIQEGRARGEHPNIFADYVTGIGTQDKGATWDAARGHTFEERAETMYRQFIEQAKRWKDADPQAEIRVAALGFSRGAEEAAYFTRLVEQRGIQDPTGAKYKVDENGLVTSVEFTKPPLVAPGQVAQAALLMDPVPTGDPRNYDRRLPPSVISAFQVTAEDERRDQFKGSRHLPDGLSDNKRFLNVTVGGAHSDIGDAYPLNGLGIRSTNLAVDYLNALSDKPFLHKRAEPEDPQRNVVHRSEQHMMLYTTKGFDQDGRRDVIEQLAPESLRKKDKGVDINSKEPVNPALDAKFERQTVPIAETPKENQGQDAPKRPTERAQGDGNILFERLAAASAANDEAGARAVVQEYLRTPEAQAWLQQGREFNQQQAQDLAAKQTQESQAQEQAGQVASAGGMRR